MDINEIRVGVAGQVDEITKNYSREERLAFIQGMLTMVEVSEMGLKLIAEEDEDCYPSEFEDVFLQIKNGLITIAENL